MGKRKLNFKRRTRKKFNKIIKRDGDIPHRLYDTNIETLEKQNWGKRGFR